MIFLQPQKKTSDIFVFLFSNHEKETSEKDQSELKDEYATFIKLCQEALDINAEPIHHPDQRKALYFQKLILLLLSN